MTLGKLEKGEIEELRREIKYREEEEKRLKEAWKKLATEARSFKAECPVCGGEYRLIGLRLIPVMEGSVMDPDKTAIVNRIRIVFQCYECGFVPEFDLDFYSKSKLEEGMKKEKEDIINLVKEALMTKV